VHPAKLLKRRLRRVEFDIAGDRGARRLVVRKGDAVPEREERVRTRAPALDGEADQVGLGLVDVEPDHAHALAPPQLHREAVRAVAALEVAHGGPRLPGRRIAHEIRGALWARCRLATAGPSCRLPSPGRPGVP